MDKYSVIRDNISAQQAAERFGVQIKRGKALCIWHSEKTPSLSFRGNVCRCFSCGNGGSAIDVTMELFCLSVKAAAEKLNEEFSLGLDFKVPNNAAEIMQHRDDVALVMCLDTWMELAQDTLIKYFRLLSSWRREYAPDKPGDEISQYYSVAVKTIDYIEFLLDCFAAKDADRIALYKVYFSFIEGVEHELKRFCSTNQRSA